jgi:hypothetical protein
VTPAAHAVPFSLPLALAGGSLLIAGVAVGVVAGWLLRPEEIQGQVEMHIVDEDADEGIAVALAEWIAENSYGADDGGFFN